VRCTDVNGHRGGHDKKCDVQVQLAGGQAVRLRETDRSLYRAVDRAAKRVRRVVKDRLGRQRTRKRSGPRRRPDRPELPSALGSEAVGQALA
jgi:ribosome-associated translation inhibitor RaiA